MATPMPTPTYTPPVSCMYAYDPVTRCESQRPCDSCLRKPGCMIGVIGACQPLSVKVADPWHYARAKERNLTLPGLKNSVNTSAIREKQDWEFPSIETAYCATDDTVCSRCIQERFWLLAGAENDSRYCVGANGCVCISNCEFNKNALKTVCPRSPEPTLYTDNDDGVATAAPPWTVPPTTASPSPTPTSTAAKRVVIIKTQSSALSHVLIAAGCLVVLGSVAWIVYRCTRRTRAAVPIAVLIKADSPNDQESFAPEPSLTRYETAHNH